MVRKGTKRVRIEEVDDLSATDESIIILPDPSDEPTISKTERDIAEGSSVGAKDSNGVLKMFVPGFVYHSILRLQSFINIDYTKGKLSWIALLTYAAPTFSTIPAISLMAVYLFTFYERLGAQLTFISFYVALARTFDVVSDPVMSYVTDSCRTSFGRRRPFMAIGSILYCFTIIFLLSPPPLDAATLSSYFGLFYILFFLCYTFTAIPYDALAPELTPDYDDRNKLYFMAGLFDGFGVLIAVALPAVLQIALDPNPVACSADSCYTDSSPFEVQDCLPSFTNGEISTYNLGEFKTRTEWENGCPTTDTSGGQFEYCECVSTCSTRCDVEEQRDIFLYIGILFGMWILITMWILILRFKERAQITKKFVLERSSPIVPSLFNTFRNRLFKHLLPAWILDNINNSIVTNLLPYYVRYVIQPEYQTADPAGGGIDCEGGNNDSWRCDSNLVLGVVITATLLGAFFATPLWLLLARCVGKHKAWLIWSFTMAITNPLFAIADKGDVYVAAALGFVNGAPLGARFLADTILADIIDYDELLTGQRNEATYTMYKSFLPKIVAIATSAVPLSILEAIGHVAPIDGRIQEQPPQIKPYIKWLSVGGATIAAISSFFIKLSFPVKHRQQQDVISAGIGFHFENKEAPDPITGIRFMIFRFSDTEIKYVNRLNHFPGTTTIDEIAIGRINSILSRAVVELVMTFFLTVANISGIYYTFELLDSDRLSVIPVVLCVTLGIFLVILVIQFSRVLAAFQLQRDLPRADLLTKVKKQRILFKKLNQAPALKFDLQEMRNIFRELENKVRETRKISSIALPELVKSSSRRKLFSKDASGGNQDDSLYNVDLSATENGENGKGADANVMTGYLPKDGSAPKDDNEPDESPKDPPTSESKEAPEDDGNEDAKN